VGGQRGSLKLVALAAGAFIILAAILWQPLRYLVLGDPNVSARIGQELPALSLEDPSGRTLTLAEVAREATGGRDSKALFILWATWCEPCVRELPLLQENQKRFSDKGYGLVLINYDGPPKEKTVPEVQAWLITQSVKIPTLFDFGSKLIDAWSIEALPFSFATDGKGAVNWAHMGYMDWNSIELP